MSNFRSVVKPERLLISTNIGSTIDFDDTYTIIQFNAGQGSSIHTLINVAHLLDGQTIPFVNNAASDITIDASLLTDGIAVDLEPGTTGFLCYNQVEGNFTDQGGTSRIKDVEEAFDAHTHNGSDGVKILGTNLNSASSTPEYVLTSDGAGNTVWKYHPSLIGTKCIYTNTDITSNLNGATGFTVEVPLLGTPIKTHSDFTASGNGITCNFTGSVFITAPVFMYSPIDKGAVETRLSSSRLGLIGPIGQGSSTRDSSGVAPFVSHYQDVIAGDTLTLMARSGGKAGTITLDSQGTSFFAIERIAE